MLNKQLDMACPYCGQHRVELITEIDPMSFNYHELTKTVCMFCGKVIEPSESITYSNSTGSSYTTAGSAYKYCDNCSTKMEPFGDNGWWYCPKCGYGHMDYIGDLPEELSDEEIESFKKLYVEKFTFPYDNIRDSNVVEINDERYKDIDTIIVNGHKFVREK